MTGTVDIDQTTMDRVFVSPRVRRWQKDEWYLYFDPCNFVWVRVNESGRFLIEQFQQYLSVPRVIQRVMDKFSIARDQAEAGVRMFVDNLVAEGFLHRNEYVPTDRASFSQLDFARDVYLHLTNKCNLACSYCYNKDDRTTKIRLAKKGLVDPVMNTEEMKRLIARLVELGTRRILFTGGEPLLRKDFVTLLKYARSLSADINLEVLTNGTKIDEAMAEILATYTDGVTISLDGHTQERHEKYRGRKTFAPMVRGTKLLAEAKRRLGRDRPYIAMVPVWTSDNVHTMPDVWEFCLEELGANGLAPILFQAGDHQELSISQIPNLGLFEDAQRRTTEYVRTFREKQGYSEGPGRGVGARNHCGVGHGEISIDPAGEVYPCQSLHYDEFKCGNVRESDVGDIFSSADVMVQVRGQKVDDLSVCRHCDLKYLCNGGCRATAYNVYRTFDAHNEVYCKYLENFALNKMWGSSGVPICK